MSKKSIFFIIVFIAMLITAAILNFTKKSTGVQNSNDSEATNQSTGTIPEISEAEMKICSQNSDCVKVQTNTCCSCAKGGGETVINRKYLEYWQQKQIESLQASEVLGVDCELIACSASYNCVDADPQCENGSCILPTAQLPSTVIP